MTLAGTRPPTVDEWDKYDLHHRARLATKPGITGMWQVSGRSNITDFEDVVKLDRQYIAEWNLERSLKNSKYNLRQDECKAAAYALMGYAGMDYDTFANTRLRDVPYEVFEAYKDRLPELWRRRAEHYYSEFARAEKGAELWRKGDLEGYGQLVFESGKSSIYNYECGCDELKKLYEIMADTDGIYGGRFSGAGFKGCCMALIDPDKAEDIEAKVTAEYLKAFPALEGKYSFHLCESADGVEL